MTCPFKLALEPDRRPDPYPLYAAMPAAPVRMENGRYVVSGYREVLSLLHDPRLSSAASREGDAPGEAVSLLRLDPPDHDRLRRIVTRQFGPPHRPEMVAGLEPAITERTHALIDALAGDREVEIVSRFAHRLPFAVICQLLAIPEEDEHHFHDWIAAILGGFGTRQSNGEEAGRKLGHYLAEIAMKRRGGTGTDMLSGLVNDDGPEGRLPEESVGAMARLLLIAGHETTVNLIANGILTLIRHPAEAARLPGDPVRAAMVVEELLRFEPPVQFITNRKTLADIELDDVTIPAGSAVTLLTAAANRDPTRFDDPARFDPDRADNQHLGFGSGIHACFGAPLARLEGQIALRLFFERVVNPRLVSEPAYRPSPLLRGPKEMVVAYDVVRERAVA